MLVHLPLDAQLLLVDFTSIADAVALLTLTAKSLQIPIPEGYWQTRLARGLWFPENLILPRPVHLRHAYATVTNRCSVCRVARACLWVSGRRVCRWCAPKFQESAMPLVGPEYFTRSAVYLTSGDE